MKTIYIIPGFKHNIDTPGYKELIQKIQEKDYSAQFIDINWKKTTLSDNYLEALDKIMPKKDDSILGFSFGAMIALKISQELYFEKIVLCSLSPYFKESLHKLPRYYKLVLGKKRWTDFENNWSAKNIRKNGEYYILYGDKETKRLIERNEIMKDILNPKKSVIMPGVSHDIADHMYQKNILDIL